MTEIINMDASGYVQPRRADGSYDFIGRDPRYGFVEGNAAQYTWMVPHNMGALINLMGGPGTAAQRLDHHFTELNGGLSRPYFYIGNEPEHGVPWAYNFTGNPALLSRFSTMERITPAVPSGRRDKERSPRSTNVYISLLTTSVLSPTPRTNKAVSSNTGNSIYP